MKLRIGGTDYDYQAALAKTPLRVLMELQTQGGPSRRAVSLALDLMDAGTHREAERERRRRAGEKVPEVDEAAALEEDVRFLLGIAGLIFISKRYAGEPITWDDAQLYTLGDLTFIVEDSDLPAEPPDPQEASGEANPPDAETKSAPNSPGKTSAARTRKTSKPRSGSTT